MDARDEQALTAVKLYFERGMSQAEVAAELGVSRPTVAKLIQLGKQRGFVTIEIHDPREADSALAQQLTSRFGLVDVRLAHLPRETDADLLRELGKLGASMLQDLVADDMSVGVSWGNTMYSVSAHLSRTDRHGVEMVQLKGGTSHSERSTFDIETINSFCLAFNATARTLPLPVIFDSVATKQVVEQDRHIARILRAGRETDLVIFTVGDVQRSSLLLNLGHLSENEIDQLLERAVGDACSRFFTADGEVAVPSIDNRTVGIELKELAARPIRLLIAGGAAKTIAIATALDMGLATHLVIDRPTALRVLDAAEQGNPASAPPDTK
ncbi:sugar-binding transcriptional regulator [Corynebacterium sp. CCM 9203]|uniref:sugar-binding transcriptional regulator n=1 Tax=Corynebacterium sp. CCM 9203 TaxID=3057615 RepID=UPI003524BD13